MASFQLFRGCRKRADVFISRPEWGDGPSTTVDSRIGKTLANDPVFQKIEICGLAPKSHSLQEKETTLQRQKEEEKRGVNILHARNGVVGKHSLDNRSVVGVDPIRQSALLRGKKIRMAIRTVSREEEIIALQVPCIVLWRGGIHPSLIVHEATQDLVEIVMRKRMRHDGHLLWHRNWSYRCTANHNKQGEETKFMNGPECSLLF